MVATSLSSCNEIVSARLKKETGSSYEELDAIVSNVKERYKALRKSVVVEQSELEIELTELMKEDQAYADAIIQRDLMIDKIRIIEQFRFVTLEGKGQEVAQRVLSLISGEGFAGHSSAANIRDTMRDRWTMALLHGVEKLGKGHLKLFASHKSDADITTAMSLYRTADIDRNVKWETKEKLDGIGQMEKDIALELNKVLTYMRKEMNEVGGNIGEYDGWAFMASYDRGRIKKMGIDKFKKIMHENVDYWRSFKADKNNLSLDDIEMIDGIMDAWYHGFSTGAHLQGSHMKDGSIHGRDGSRDPKGGNVASKISQSRVIHYRDGESFFNVQKQMGMGTLADAMGGQIGAMSSSYGLLSKLGPHYRDNIDDLVGLLIHKAEKEGDNDGAAALINRKLKNSLEKAFDNIDGKSSFSTREWVSSTKAVSMTVQLTSKLGASAVAVVMDPASMAMSSQELGRTMLSGIGDAIDGLFHTKTSKADKMAVAKAMGIELTATRQLLTEALGTGHVAGRMAKLASAFMRINFVTPFSNALKGGHVIGQSIQLGHLVSLPYADLKDITKRSLAKNGIEPDMWGILSLAVSDVETSHGTAKFLDPDEIPDMSDEYFVDVLHSRGSPINSESISQLKRDTQLNVQQWMRTNLQGAIIEPSQRTQDLLKVGNNGEIPNLLWSLFMQFKSHPIAQFSQRVLRDVELRTDERAGFNKATFGKEGISSWAGAGVQYMMLSTAFGYVAMSLKAISQGKTPPDATNPTVIRDAFLKGGAGSVYMDMILGQSRVGYGVSGLDAFMGPTFGAGNDLMNVASKWKNNEDYKASLFRLLVNNAPGGNLLYTKAAIDYLFLDAIRNEINPNRPKALEEKAAETGQSYFVDKAR